MTFDGPDGKKNREPFENFHNFFSRAGRLKKILYQEIARIPSHRRSPS
jgi:hypothetical protein